MDRLKIKPTKIRLIYENRFIRVWDDEVVFPNGSPGTYIRFRWRAPYGVAVVATDGAAILLLETHRYGEPHTSWEIPQGFGSDGSTPEADARRELREETGLQAAELEPLLVAGAQYQQHVFLTRLSDLSAAHAGGAEADEVIAGFKQVPLAALRAPDFAALGVIDSLTMAALAVAARKI